MASRGEGLWRDRLAGHDPERSEPSQGEGCGSPRCSGEVVRVGGARDFDDDVHDLLGTLGDRDDIGPHQVGKLGFGQPSLEALDKLRAFQDAAPAKLAAQKAGRFFATLSSSMWPSSQSRRMSIFC